MRLVATSLLFLVACKPGLDGDYPIEPGGGNGNFGTGVGTTPDSGTTTDGGATINARVCGLSEILRWDECDQIGLDGLTVTVSTSQATTSMDGNFQIASPSGSNLVWKVSGNTQMPSIREFPGDLVIPSITVNAYEDLTADAGVVIDNNVGTIFVQLMKMGAPVVGAEGSITGSTELVYYDDANGSAPFSVGATRASGIIWFPNVAPGLVTFTVTPPAGSPKDTVVTVEANSATFATVVF